MLLSHSLTERWFECWNILNTQMPTICGTLIKEQKEIDDFLKENSMLTGKAHFYSRS